MAISILDASFAEDILEVKSEKQGRILAASIKLFAQKGSANTSTAEIAKAAQVSVGTLFNYYKTKDDLLIAIIVPAMKKLFAQMDCGLNLKNSANLEDYLTELLKIRMNYFKQNWELFQVAAKEVFYREELKKAIIPKFQEAGFLFLTQIVEHYQQQGELTGLSTEKIVKFILNVIVGFTILKLLSLPAHLVSDAEIAEIASFTMNGLNNGTI